mmetsp:Transcript_29149/g.44498  ORF Transcript_29149/g.44498 Transcript_29149/m.44498 type:complete len:137 (+) Transcript_29149:506-916(+)
MTNETIDTRRVINILGKIMLQRPTEPHSPTMSILRPLRKKDSWELLQNEVPNTDVWIYASLLVNLRKRSIVNKQHWHEQMMASIHPLSNPERLMHHWSTCIGKRTIWTILIMRDPKAAVPACLVREQHKLPNTDTV